MNNSEEKLKADVERRRILFLEFPRKRRLIKVDCIKISTYEVRMVRGEDFSDKMFQNPGGYLPGRLIREPQL